MIAFRWVDVFVRILWIILFVAVVLAGWGIAGLLERRRKRPPPTG
jgi:hypothetical protein